MKRYIFLLAVVAMLVSPCLSADLKQPWCGSPAIYFSHAVSPDIPGYEGLKIYPDGAPAEDENVTVKNTLGQVLIDSYISDPTLPRVSSIRAGLWRFRTFHYVSSTAGVTKANFTVYKRSSTGVETFLFYVETEDIESTASNEYLTSYVMQTDTPMAQSDRIVIRVYGESTHSANVQLHFLYEGTTSTSHVVPSLLVCSTGGAADNTAMGLVLALTGGFLGAIIISRRGKIP